MHWSVCSVPAGCRYHRTVWNEATAGRSVLHRQGVCRKQWGMCRADECQWHLIKKRFYKTFPGHPTTFQHQIRENNHNWNKITKCCELQAWYYCLNDTYLIYRDSKIRNRIIVSGKDKSFELGVSSKR